MDDDRARTALLDAAESLFYARGIQAVGMDEIRSRAGISLKRLYQLYPSKEQLVVGALQRRDTVWRGRLTRHVNQHVEPQERLLAVFDWLGEWFSEPDFRGCAWINAFGELGDESPPIAAQVREHQTAVKALLAGLVSDAGLPEALADQLYLLVEGATVTAGVFATRAPAETAKTTAAVLISQAMGE